MPRGGIEPPTPSLKLVVLPKEISLVFTSTSAYFATPTYDWNGGTRTHGCESQNLMPYHLATSQFKLRVVGIEPTLSWL